MESLKLKTKLDNTSRCMVIKQRRRARGRPRPPTRKGKSKADPPTERRSLGEIDKLKGPSLAAATDRLKDREAFSLNGKGGSRFPIIDQSIQFE